MRKNSWRKGKKWRGVRAKVRRKCNNRCIICKTRGVDIHHIEDASSKPKLRYRHYNLVCLCRECHRVYFHMYFKGGTHISCNGDDWFSFKMIANHFLGNQK